MNVITIELCAEDRARLDKIIERLGALHNCSSCVEGVAQYMDQAAAILDGRAGPVPAPAPVEEAAPVEAAAPAVDAPKPAEAPKPAVTLAQIQKKATEVAAASAEKRAAVRSVVNKYAVRVSDLPEHAWGEVWAALCKLESEG